ncbi:hypothetical protein ACSBRZ_32300 [Pseudomonas aeruginosa]|uniref:hypothetical protein n=1 Tax=Pseudomonas aeruginosa TaxID=287 RepID=UPI003EC15596
MSIRQSFEYHVENIVIPYKTLTKGVAMFKHKEDTLEPDDHALLNPLRWCSGLLIPDTDLGENPRRERGV